MTSAPGPARELTDAEIVDLALNRLVAIGPLDREARENGLAALARLAACAEERDKAREALTMLRDAWNQHFRDCPSPAPKLPMPTAENIAAWMNAPSDTASA